MIKVKTTTTTKKIYSVNGKSFWIQYTEENKETILMLCKYAMSDLKKGVVPFTVMVSELEENLSFKVEDEETKAAYLEIFEEINKTI